ncbi:hypothetical protein DFS34DRAFT_460912 [Phlyctochytrium arcticum]|nr:hypothetical protein DFS34DRAFT_460912 [Phlyctochytrium arcticum]
MSQTLALPDDIWLIVMSHLTQEYRDLVKFSRICRRFKRLAKSNRSWYEAYTATYPQLSCPYEGTNWRRKLAASKACTKRWENLGERQTSVLELVFSNQKLASCVPSISFPEPHLYHMYHTGFCPDQALEYGKPRKPEEISDEDVMRPSGLVAFSVCIKDPEMDGTGARRTTVCFLELGTGQLGGSACFDGEVAVRHMDAQRGFYVVGRRISDQSASLQCCLMPAAGELSGINDDPKFHISHLDLPQDVEVFALSTYSPASSNYFDGRSEALLVVLGISDIDTGVRLIYDYKSGRLIERREMGRDVSTIEMGEPYDSIILTGHFDGHHIRIWDFATGAPLVSLVTSDLAGPVLGLTWVDNPENWLCGEWKRPKSLAIAVFTDAGDVDDDLDDDSRTEDMLTVTQGAAGGNPLTVNTGVLVPDLPAYPPIPQSPLVPVVEPTHPPSHAPISGRSQNGGNVVVWDIGDLLHTAQTRLNTHQGSLRRTVSLPPVKRPKGHHPPLAHPIRVEGNDSVATYCVLHPLLIVITTKGWFEAIELETGRSLCRVHLSPTDTSNSAETLEEQSFPGVDVLPSEGLYTPGDWIIHNVIRYNGELWVGTHKGLLRLKI